MRKKRIKLPYLPGFDPEDPGLEERMGYVKAVFAARRGLEKIWSGAIAIPPGSIIEDVCKEWQDNTSIPLEIPFHTFFSLTAGYLVEKGVGVSVKGRIISPDFWTIILGSSGGGKTWTKKELKDVVGSGEISATGAAGAAAWLQTLSENPRGLWVRDEFLQFLKQLEQTGPMSEVKDYLLRVYDNETIVRKTKRDEIVVERPALVILAFNVFETFARSMSIESLTDGFAQRFGYVLAKEDPARKWREYPLWEIPQDLKMTWRERLDEIKRKILPTYESGEEGIDAFKRTFKNFSGIDIPESFFRRVLWKSHKYALIYHVLRNPSEQMIDEEDYGWASRLIGIELSHASEVLEKSGLSDLAYALEAVEGVVKRLKEKKEPITVRAVVRGTRAVRNVAEARAFLDLLGIVPEK